MDKFLRKCSNAEEVKLAKEGSCSTSKSDGACQESRKRKYNSSFLEYGFTSVLDNDVEKPRCLLCDIVLCSESLKPSKLRRHFETKHKDYQGKSRGFFEKKLEQVESQGAKFAKFTFTSDSALRASYEVSYKVAKAMKPHTIAESLIVPAAIDMVTNVCGAAQAQKLKKIPLSNDTVKRRIVSIADAQEDNLLSRLRQTEAFALQTDASTEGRTAHLLAYVRYVWEEDVLEDFLFCLPLPQHEKAQDMFSLFNKYFEDNGIQWDKLVGFCTDGAPCMSGKRAGLRTLISQKAPSCVWSHCMLHREQLASKELSPELSAILNTVVSIVNDIKSKPLQARIFSNLCRDCNSEHEVLVLHTAVRWLSRGNVLCRFFELRNELEMFYSGERNSPDFLKFLRDPQNVFLMAYLCDIFSKLNELNLGMQGKQTNILVLHDRLEAFRTKIIWWVKKVEQSDFNAFPTLDELRQFGNYPIESCKLIIAQHLHRLAERFASYFPDVSVAKYDWVRNPYRINPLQLEEPFVEELIELKSSRDMEALFSSSTLTQFWSKTRDAFPASSREARRVLVPFATSYLCEAGFSALVAIKTKYRQRLDVSADIRCVLSQLAPDIDMLCASMQAHVSH